MCYRVSEFHHQGGGYIGTLSVAQKLEKLAVWTDPKGSRLNCFRFWFLSFTLGGGARAHRVLPNRVFKYGGDVDEGRPLADFVLLRASFAVELVLYRTQMFFLRRLVHRFCPMRCFVYEVRLFAIFVQGFG